MEKWLRKMSTLPCTCGWSSGENISHQEEMGLRLAVACLVFNFFCEVQWTQWQWEPLGGAFLGPGLYSPWVDRWVVLSRLVQGTVPLPEWVYCGGRACGWAAPAGFSWSPEGFLPTYHRGQAKFPVPSSLYLCSLKGCSSLGSQSAGRQACSWSWMSFSAMGILGLVWRRPPIPISLFWPVTWIFFGWLKPGCPGEDTVPGLDHGGPFPAAAWAVLLTVSHHHSIFRAFRPIPG